MPTPQVSVIIPAFNRRDTILEATRSVLDQTYGDLELIVVDDGSSDGTLASLEVLDDPRLRLISLGENRGVSAARNYGLAASRAPWVAFQDSDDLWRADKLEQQMALLADEGAGYVAAYCGMEIEAGGTTRYVPDRSLAHREGNVLPDLVRTSFISTQTLVVRRDILDTVGGFDAEQTALVDWELMLRVAQLGDVALADEALVRQRFSPNSITGDPRRRVRARARLVAQHSELMERFPGVLAEHHYALSGGYRQCGDLEKAAAHMAEARRRRPMRPLWWLAAARLGLLRLTTSRPWDGNGRRGRL